MVEIVHSSPLSSRAEEAVNHKKCPNDYVWAFFFAKCYYFPILFSNFASNLVRILIFMVHNIFKGLGIALITPFMEDGSVDYKSLIRLVEYQLDNGADFFCILATTGETPTLTQDEKQKIKDLVVDLVGGRVPILMGCGGNNTADVVHELQTGDFRGINGILSVCPYYNKPSQEGLYQHFKAIAAATTLPVV